MQRFGIIDRTYLKVFKVAKPLSTGSGVPFASCEWSPPAIDLRFDREAESISQSLVNNNIKIFDNGIVGFVE